MLWCPATRSGGSSSAKVSASKKTVFATEQDRPDIARRRAWWRRHQSKIDPARLVFIDETWTKTNMARTHGWWRRGFPLRAQVPHGHWRTMTFLAALRHDHIAAPCVIDGPINGESFRAYVEQVLVPTLQPGDIVVIDNLGSHKSCVIRTRSGQRVRGSSSFRPTRRTSTLSSRSSQSSKFCSARRRSAAYEASGAVSAACSR